MHVRQSEAISHKPFWLVGIALSIGAMILAGLFVLRTPARTVAPSGKPLPRVSGASSVAEAKRLAKAHGVAIVNIWATWCEPCRHEMPELARLQREWKDRAAVYLISADNESDEAAVQTFLAQSGIESAGAIVGGNHQSFIETWQAFSSPDPARQWSMTLPVTFVIDDQGAMRKMLVGATSRVELEKIIQDFAPAGAVESN